MNIPLLVNTYSTRPVPPPHREPHRGPIATPLHGGGWRRDPRGDSRGVGWGEGRERGEKTRKTLVRYLHPRSGLGRRFEAATLAIWPFGEGIKTANRNTERKQPILERVATRQPVNQK